LRDEAHRIRVPDGGRERLAETVAALRRPASYPGQVQRIEAIETHMSWVFLTETHAYKLKKPLRTELIDHATVADRHRACATELDLNRRLARSVYLSIEPVVRIAKGVRVGGGEGEVIDWLVKMRRLSDARMLDVSIRHGAVTADQIGALAEILADFFSRATRVELAGPVYRERIAADIASKRSSLAQPRYGLPNEEVDGSYAAQHEWLARHGGLLEDRAARVVDGHGDLRPEHVCLEDPPVVIDCLEFAQELRWLDPASELAFLGLECRRLGAEWIGGLLLDGYEARTGDRPPAELIAFYEGQHALIRAAIAIWHLDDDALAQAEHWRERAREYLRMATSRPRDRRS
jgi:uncharacterized protein